MLGLYRSRAKVVRFILGGVMVLVSLSMLTYLIPSYGTGASSANGSVVAQVGKDAITVPDVQRAVHNTIAARQLPQATAPMLVPRVVRDMVADRSLAYEAQRLGFRVSDAEVRAGIRQSLPGLYPDGHFVGDQAYADMLSQQNLTIPEFEAELRRQILVSRLVDIIDAGVIVTPQETEQAYRRDHEKFRISWVKLTPAQYRGESTPSDADIAAYYNANRASFQMPEKRDLAVLIADRASIEQSLRPPEDELQSMYQQNIAQYRLPETVDLRQILLKNDAARAADLVRRLRSGANFADLAAKFSEDAASAPKGGEYKGVRRGQLEPALEQVAFSLQPGQIGDPVKTSYGYVIVQVEKHDAARVRPFTEVKPELAQQWKRQRAAARLQEIADQAEAGLRKDPEHPDKVAAQFQLQLVRVAAYEAGKTIPQVGDTPAFYQAAASLNNGGVSQAVPLGDRGFAIAVVQSIAPSRQSTLAEPRDRIRDILIENRSQAAMQKHAQALWEKAKSMGGDLAGAAKSMGLDAKVSGLVERSSDVPGLGSVSPLGTLLDQPAGALSAPVAVSGGTVIAKVAQKEPADMSGFASESASVRDHLRAERARDRESLFTAGLAARLSREGKLHINQALIESMARNYAA